MTISILIGTMKNIEIIFSFFKFVDSCVLIITGAFNPIHRSHIANLRLVKNYLENHESRPMNVLAAYLSPTQYVLLNNFTVVFKS
jgi:hypothetical protein